MGRLLGGTMTGIALQLLVAVVAELVVAGISAGATRMLEGARNVTSRVRGALPKRLHTPPPVAMSEVVQDFAGPAASRASLDASAAVPLSPTEALVAPGKPVPTPRPAAPHPHAPMTEARALSVKRAIGRPLPAEVRELSEAQLNRLLDKGRRVQRAKTPDILRSARQKAIKGQAQEELAARLPALQEHRARWRELLKDDPVWDPATAQFTTEMRVGNARGWAPEGRLLDAEAVQTPLKPRPKKVKARRADDVGALDGLGIPDDPGTLASGPDVPLIVLSRDRTRMRVLMDVQVKSKRNVAELAITEDGMGQFLKDRERIVEFASEVALDLPEGELRLRFDPEYVTFDKNTELVAVTASDIALPAQARDLVKRDFAVDATAANTRLIELHLPLSNGEIDDFVSALVEAIEKGKL
jgi:hypothetical protein